MKFFMNLLKNVPNNPVSAQELFPDAPAVPNHPVSVQELFPSPPAVPNNPVSVQ